MPHKWAAALIYKEKEKEKESTQYFLPNISCLSRLAVWKSLFQQFGY